MAGSGSDGVLGSCLKALEIPLIDRRRIRAAFPAYQVALPRARVDVGDADRTAEELEAWNLSPEETARNLVASLREGSEAQQRALLNAKIYTSSRRNPRLWRRVPSLPQEPQAQPNARDRIADPVGRAVAEASPLAAFCDAQLRALSDFARLVEVFDANHVSFVSVTQAFNTTTSMGRLTLNMLLSFAQFEREVTGERIRDKIAASKKKGMWMGGLPPLGYDVQDKKLVANEAEAETVRTLFRLYLEHGTVKKLVEESARF
ncbi:MAG: recombinase family protein, partial [Myxococcales bacterium]|nr:recombinase family protein [Myxococcales bacterium]